MGYIIAFLIVTVIVQFLGELKSIYKIAYYEKTCKLKGIDISEVKDMTLWQMLFS